MLLLIAKYEDLYFVSASDARFVFKIQISELESNSSIDESVFSRIYINNFTDKVDGKAYTNSPSNDVKVFLCN